MRHKVKKKWKCKIGSTVGQTRSLGFLFELAGAWGVLKLACEWRGCSLKISSSSPRAIYAFGSFCHGKRQRDFQKSSRSGVFICEQVQHFLHLFSNLTMVRFSRLHTENSLFFSGVEAKFWEKVLKKHVLFKKSFENEVGSQNRNYHNIFGQHLRRLVCGSSVSVVSPLCESQKDQTT